MTPYLLCTDLDRTLIPNGSQAVSPEAMQRFTQLVQRDDITLAYVTGRHRSLIQDAITRYDLPQPDFAIADVGSTIYQVEGTHWHQWRAWDEEISADWKGLIHDDIYALLNTIPSITLQESEKQNRHKLSFYTPTNIDKNSILLNINNILQSNNIKANLIWSIDEASEVGLLDILPASANKLHAIRFLMQAKNFSQDRTVFAGDSGNDLDVVLSDIPSVLVANAHAEIKTQLKLADPASVYLAQGNYLGMNGNYSAGILEGVAHYWPEIASWLNKQAHTT